MKIKKNLFNVDENATFFVVVKKMFTAVQHSDYAIQQVNFVSPEPLFVWINCVKNCRPTVLIHEIFHAQVICENCETRKGMRVQWTLNSRVVGSSARVVILSHRLADGRNILEVKVEENDRIGQSIIIIRPIKPPAVAQCEIKPPEGRELLTKFNIACNTTAIKFNVFQDTELIGKFYSSPVAIRLQRSNGLTVQLVVQLVDDKGAISSMHLNALVEKLPVSNVSQFLQPQNNQNLSLHQLVDSNDFQAAAIMIYVAVDNMNLEDESSIERIINELLLVQLVDNESISIMANILKKLCEKVSTNHRQRMQIGLILNSVSSELNPSAMFKIDEARNLAKTLLQVVQNISFPFKLMASQEAFTAKDNRLDEYTDYDDFDSEIGFKMDNLLSAGNNMKKMLTKLLRLLANFVEPTEPIFEVELPDFKLMVVSEEVFESESNQNYTLHETTVTLGIENVKPHKIIKLGLISFAHVNPFWFDDDENVTRSNFVTIAIFSEDGGTIKKLSEPIKILPAMVEDLHRAQSSEEHYVCIEPLKELLTFIIKPISYSTILINFKISDDSKLKYLAQFKEKLQFKDFLFNRRSVKTINGSSSIQIETNQHFGDFFISFISDRVGNTECINLTLDFFIISCNLWNVEKGTWSRNFCEVNNVLNQWNFECLCKKVGSFVATVRKSYAGVDPTRKIRNSMEPNYIVVEFLVSAILVSLIFTAACRRKKAEIKVTHLPSCHPNSTHQYLITVTNGASRYSGTSSKISIEILGSNFSSGNHWLEDKHDKFKIRRSKSCFLLTTPSNLGDVEKLILWNNPLGNKPSWQCETVEVHDLERGKKSVFFVQKWFRLINSSSQIRHEIDCATENNVEVKRSTLFENHVIEEFNRSFKFNQNLGILGLPFLVKILQLILLMSAVSFTFGPTEVINIEDENLKFQKYDVGRALQFSFKSFSKVILMKILFDLISNALTINILD